MKVENIKPTKVHKSWYLRIPAAYIKVGMIDPEKSYDYEVKEAEVSQ